MHAELTTHVQSRMKRFSLGLLVNVRLNAGRLLPRVCVCLRSNLDPAGLHTDEEICHAMQVGGWVITHFTVIGRAVADSRDLPTRSSPGLGSDRAAS